MFTSREGTLQTRHEKEKKNDVWCELFPAKKQHGSEFVTPPVRSEDGMWLESIFE